MPVDGTLSTTVSAKSRIVKAGIPLAMRLWKFTISKTNFRKNRNRPKIIVEVNGQAGLHPRFFSFQQTVGWELRLARYTEGL